ncbi:cation:proton antiporter subunit C [Aliiglaciecola sp. LCG003]|uniref:cation:proton antiporter subunit C n=1 Tax=Aliiglaciecola sp. LCG003 TaxID=3053655 RepID=UPI002573CF99|nr:cation:proton antiporter subunit C [Aliiglaciecola sp. LCG003]WJG08217.1 cation:proton antiporter subunit C [Aliiglaciecola sp. LCG003]
MMEYVLGHINYWIIILLMMTGLYTMMSKPNLIKKMAGLSVFQTGVILLYISLGKVTGGTAPIIADGFDIYSNPLPQVLMLTAIVVGVATTALGFALIVRIKEAYGTIEEDELEKMDGEV